MKCSKCGSENMTIQIVEKGQVTKRKGNGAAGHAINMLRVIAILCTCGIAAFFWRKRKGENFTETKTEKIAICQDCGTTYSLGAR